MKNFQYLITSLIIVAAAGTFCLSHARDTFVDPTERFRQVLGQDPTKIVVTKLGDKPETKTLTRIEEIRNLRESFTAVRFKGFGALCHAPIYRIEAYRNDDPLYSVTICWRCYNVKVSEPKDIGVIGFPSESPHTEAFKEALASLFTKKKA